MNIYDIEQAFKQVVINLPEFNNYSFASGETYDFAISGADKYPLLFLQQPLQLTHFNDRLSEQLWTINFRVDQYILSKDDNPDNVRKVQGYCQDLCYLVLKELKSLGFGVITGVQMFNLDPQSLSSGDDRSAGISCTLVLKTSNC